MVSVLMLPFLSFRQQKLTQSPSLLSNYYAVKNALVNSDATNAAKAAGDFVLAVKTIDVKSLTTGEQNAFTAVQAKLVADANSIATTKDIAKQRAAFQTLSANMITFVKASKTAKPTHIAYCPMKKAYWLSAEQAIKNPYYGNSMLTCGNVTETLK